MAPREALQSIEISGQYFRVSFYVHDRQRAAVIALDRMIGERDHVTSRRNPRMPNPSAGFIEHFANWELEPVASVYIAHDCQIGPIRRPVGPLNLLHDLSRCTASDRSSCERPHVYPRTSGLR